MSIEKIAATLLTIFAANMVRSGNEGEARTQGTAESEELLHSEEVRDLSTSNHIHEAAQELANVSQKMDVFLTQARDLVAGTDERLNNLTGDVDRVTHLVDTLQRRFDDYTADASAISQLAEGLDNNNHQILELKTMVMNTQGQGELCTLRESVPQLRQQIDELRSTVLAQGSATIDRLNALDLLRKELDSSSEVNRETRVAILELKSSLNNPQSSFEFNSLRLECNSLRESIPQLREQIEDLRNYTVAQNAAAIQELSAAVLTLREQVQELAREIREKSSQTKPESSDGVQQVDSRNVVMHFNLHP